MKTKSNRTSKTKSQALGCSLGFKKIDKYTCGLKPEQLMIFAAYPGVGRSSFALNVAQKLAIEQRIPTAVMSFELTKQQVLVRLACSHAKIDLMQLYLGKGSEKAQEKFTETLSEIARAPLEIFAAPRMTLMELQHEARRIKERCKVRLIIVDSLQQLSFEGLTQDRLTSLKQLLTGVKLLSKELQIPILLTNQWVGKRAQDKEFLKENKILEKEADIFCVLAAHEAFEEQKSKMISEINAVFNFVKNRNGSVGKANLAFLPKYSRFED
jgi:replicative DNA helicase